MAEGIGLRGTRLNVPAETVGCSGVTAWRRLRNWTEAGVWPRLHTALLAGLRRAALLDLDDCSVEGSHVRAFKGGTSAPHSSTAPAPASLGFLVTPQRGR
ncbi:hypothetical protein SALBM135S_01630 [Streptomyces alboniger]